MTRRTDALDKYATYTYHFELHVAGSASALQDNGPSVSTTRFEGTDIGGDLVMINTRKDAHQTIDNVVFECLAPDTAGGGTMVPSAKIALEVLEPGGFGFIEKLTRAMAKFNCTNYYMLQFGLKIFIVGRTPDNKVETLAQPMIPMLLGFSTGAFTPEGGRYGMTFFLNGTAGSTHLGHERTVDEGGNTQNYAKVWKTVSFQASTVQEAIQKLEDRLNRDYDDIYKYELNNSQNAKRFKYKLLLDSRVYGKLTSMVRETMSADAPVYFTSSPFESIESVITKIMKLSPELLARVSNSAKTGLKTPLEAGILMPIIIPKVYPTESEVQVIYDISIYEGSTEASSNGNVFEFDYYFAGAGKNVDVMNFNIIFNNLTFLPILNSNTGLDVATNQSALNQDASQKNSTHTRETQKTLTHRAVARSDINLKQGDIAFLPVPSAGDRFGWNNYPAIHVPTLKLATGTYADLMGAVNPFQDITIRGHYELLSACMIDPGAGSGSNANADQFWKHGLWAKVNIWMPDSRFPEGKRPFFYTGYYKIMKILHTFSAGVYIQQLRLLMQNVDGDVSTAVTVTDTPQASFRSSEIMKQNG